MSRPDDEQPNVASDPSAPPRRVQTPTIHEKINRRGQAQAEHRRALSPGAVTQFALPDCEQVPKISASLTDDATSQELLDELRKQLGMGDAFVLEELVRLSHVVGQLYRQGQFERALEPATCAVRLARHHFGDDHPRTLPEMNNLAAAYQGLGRYAEAGPLLERALAGCERALGPDHADTLTSVNNLGGLLQQQGRYVDAEPLVERALKGFERVYGPDHRNTLTALNNLGFTLLPPR